MRVGGRQEGGGSRVVESSREPFVVFKKNAEHSVVSGDSPFCVALGHVTAGPIPQGHRARLRLVRLPLPQPPDRKGPR